MMPQNRDKTGTRTVDRGSNGRFLPGNSANPGGRPKSGNSFRDVILAQITAIDPATGISVRETIVSKAVELALRGVPWALQWVVERVDGKAPVSLFVETPPRNPLEGVPDEVLRRVLDLGKEKLPNA